MIDCDDNNPFVGDIGIDNDCDGIVSMMIMDDNDEGMDGIQHNKSVRGWKSDCEWGQITVVFSP